ncbi:hypothetical protein [Micromonospora chalcea]|uniref:hypothetical protein n=1 Tax=Micromonospora chalcea TaxID=1874 RepID=UPI003D715A25
MTTIDPITAALEAAPPPTAREDATRDVWLRHYAALALGAYAKLRAEIRDLPPEPAPGSRPDLGYLALIANSATAAAMALTHQNYRAPARIWDLTPECGSLNGEHEEWLARALTTLGVNPATIDPDLNPADWSDDFGPFLAQQMQDPTVRAAYEAERADRQVAP